VFGPGPDLVLSGINVGANTGRFLQLHSGTLGGALTGANLGLRGMGVSIDTITADGIVPSDQSHWATAAALATELIGRLMDRPEGTAWNLNVPNLARADIKGLAEASPATTPLRLAAKPVAEGRAEMVFVSRDTPTPLPGTAPTDRDLLADGWAAITGVRPTSDVALGPVDLTLHAPEPG
jgi:5'-nucleotidase